MTGELAIGVDLGGTQVRAALVSAGGRILSRASALTSEDGPDAVIEQINLLTCDVAGHAGTRTIVGVGVCSPGPLDTDAGFVFDIPTLKGWKNLPFRKMLETRLGRKVVLENDGIAAALGEWRFGAGRGLRNLVYVTVSTGLGGGVVLDNRLVRGNRGLAGHMGHMKIMMNGPQCVCGGRGCWEALAGGTQFARAAQVQALAHQGSDLHRLARDGNLTTEHIAEAARRGDALAADLMQCLAEYLGYGMSNLLHLYSPERIVIGGGVANSLDLFQAKMIAALRNHAMAPFCTIDIVRAGLANNSGLIGAATLLMGPDRFD
jgi:glucokinase